MSEVTIVKMDGTTIHFINATCQISDILVTVRQYNDDGSHCTHIFEKHTLKSISYDMDY